MSNVTKLPRKPHGILAIAYVLSTWGETSPGDLEAACRESGIDDAQCQEAVAKLIELGNVKIEHDRYVWIGAPYESGVLMTMPMDYLTGK